MISGKWDLGKFINVDLIMGFCSVPQANYRDFIPSAQVGLSYLPPMRGSIVTDGLNHLGTITKVRSVENQSHNTTTDQSSNRDGHDPGEN